MSQVEMEALRPSLEGKGGFDPAAQQRQDKATRQAKTARRAEVMRQGTPEQKQALAARVKAEVQALADRYCERLSPRQLEVLGRYLSATRRELDGAAQLEARRAGAVRGATGTAGDVEEPGAPGLGLVRTCVSQLRNVPKYDLREAYP